MNLRVIVHRFSFLGLLGLVVIFGSCGSSVNAAGRVNGGAPSPVKALPRQYTSFASAGCAKNGNSIGPDQEISQSMDGAISACIRIGALGPGNYSLAVDVIAPAKGALPAKQGVTVSSSTVEPAVQISLSPASGPPGSVLKVTGRLAAPLPRQVGHAELCWDGCESGLRYQGVALKWIKPTEFMSSIVVPGAPWFRSGENAVAPLASGDYAVSVECLSEVKGCGLGGSEGSATYHLNASPRSLPWCSSEDECARLSASPAITFPGDVIKVTGFAPLQSIIGSSQPFVFQLKITPGKAPAGELNFSSTAKGGSEILVGHAGIVVQAPPEVSTLGKVKPASIEFSGSSPITENPANPGEIVWCSRGKIGVSGLNSNESISTVAAGRELVGLGYGLVGGPVPQCDSVALADGGPAGKIVLASFLVDPNYQAPIFQSIALQTSDQGKHWTPVPAPLGAQIDGFAGFRYQGSSLQALFAPSAAKTGAYVADAGAIPLVEMLKAGDTSWQPGTLACPARGPCITYGSYLPGSCAQLPSLQTILYSLDSGGNWHKAAWPSQVQNCEANEIVAVSRQTELLFSSGSPYLVRESVDGGSSWRVLGVPPVPGVASDSLADGIDGAELQMLSNGSLLVTGGRANGFEWDLLSPGSKDWCPVEGLPAGVQSSSKNAFVYQVGNTLYWISASSSIPPKLHSIPLSALKC
ncbi:MAG: hypothetical protein EPN30_00950 [Actinomycetota bacterium]|nr:MAG: hypothetical protein EPN30_00950 [Actinomycetota bacterium]